MLGAGRNTEDIGVAISKAVITAAGRGPRLYPVADTVQKAMLPLVDRDGLAKPVIQIIAEEALDSGIEEVCIVCAPGDDARYREQLGQLRTNLTHAYEGIEWAQAQAERLDRLMRSLRFAFQEEPLGYGHAVHCAKDFVGHESFLLLLSDHLYLSHVDGKRCAQQLLELAEQEECAVAAVNPPHEHLVHRYGTLSGRRVPDLAGVYTIERIIEKPTPSLAELELQTPGLRVGHYLCLFGMHVLPHSVFDWLEQVMADGAAPEAGWQLTPALQELANREKYLAAELQGARYDIGAQFGLLYAQIALGMESPDRDRMLEGLVTQLADHSRQEESGGG